MCTLCTYSGSWHYNYSVCDTLYSTNKRLLSSIPGYFICLTRDDVYDTLPNTSYYLKYKVFIMVVYNVVVCSLLNSRDFFCAFTSLLTTDNNRLDRRWNVRSAFGFNNANWFSRRIVR